MIVDVIPPVHKRFQYSIRFLLLAMLGTAILVPLVIANWTTIRPWLGLDAQTPVITIPAGHEVVSLQTQRTTIHKLLRPGDIVMLYEKKPKYKTLLDGIVVYDVDLTQPLCKFKLLLDKAEQNKMAALKHPNDIYLMLEGVIDGKK